MENKYQIELVIKDDLSLQELEITNRYWNVKDGVFNEKPSDISNDFELDTFSLSKIAKKSGHLIITTSCIQCKTEHTLKVFSQTKAKQYLNSSWECDTCIEEKKETERKRIALLKNQVLETRAKKFEKAINEKSWKAFSKQELYFLLQMLKAPTAKHLIAGIKELDDNNYWKVLHKADDHGLVDLVKHNGYYITDFFCHENITELIQGYIKSLIKVTPSLSSSKPIHPAIGFRMIKNPRIKDTDDALNYGDITFDRDIIIKAGAVYSYSVWPRENGDTWLSIAPSDNILKSKNIPRPNGPQIIGDIIKKWKI